MAHPRPTRRSALRVAGVVAVIVVVVAVAYFRGPVSVFLRDDDASAPLEVQPAKWVEAAGAAPTSVAPQASAPAAPPPEPQTQVPERKAPLAAELPFAIDLARPVRITWPLDVGPDTGSDRKGGRLCLRARQGANELLTTGPGDALYAVRLAAPARCRVWFRGRYSSDGVGNLECNNSLRFVMDDRAPVLIGNDNVSRRWGWHRGPLVELAKGLHWLRFELREDGLMLDRLALVAASVHPKPEELDALAPIAFHGLAGEAEPRRPQHPIQAVELFALPTASLVIGAGHANEIAVCASWQGREGEGFEGTISIHSNTARRVTAKGDRRIACGPSQPFARRVVQLEFSPQTARRVHTVTVVVADGDGKPVFRDQMQFVKPFAWAFLGPFPDAAPRATLMRRRKGSVVDESLACERSPMLLARLREASRLGLPQQGVKWRIVDDGSCCDWTGAIDLQKVYGKAENVFAYAVTWLDSRAASSRRLVSLQADDAAWLWVNGSFLVQLPTELPREANRLWTSGPLRRGANPVVIKLTQSKGYWGFQFEIVNWHWQGRKGRHDVITGLEPNQWPRR